MSDVVKNIERLIEVHGRAVKIPTPERPWWKFFTPTPNNGWLWLEPEKDGCYSVTWGSDRSTHRPSFGPAYAVDISKETGELAGRYGLTGAWRSVLSMWPIRDEDKARAAYEKIVRLIEKCASALPPQ